VSAGALAAIPSFRLSGVYLAVATFGFGLLLQNLIYPTFLMFGQSDIVSIPRPHLFGINAQSDRAYYFVALVVAAVCAGAVIAIRRSRLGRLLRGMSDSPLALEAHGANTRLTRLYVFGAAAGISAVGGVIIAGVTQSAGGTPTGPFGYFNSVVLLAVLAICGSQPILSPVLAAFLFEVVKIYRPFSNAWFSKYEGVFFGVGALAVAVVPGMRLSLSGRRTAARDGRSPVTSRARLVVPRPVRVSSQGTRP
jgi:ABC-type branched-subunit amino acid transport system permease subunit